MLFAECPFFVKGGLNLDIRSLRKRDELMGKTFKTNKCGECVVVEYTNNRNVKIEFLSPSYTTKCNLEDLKRGKAYNPLYHTLYGKGCIGVGKYSSSNKEAYSLWLGIFKRVCDLEYHKRQPTYSSVTICDEWLNFQNFAEWCYNQKFFNDKDDRGNPYQLDKDFLSSDKKVYSPETCCFIPSCINKLLQPTRCDKEELPTGVSLSKRTGKFLSYLNRFGKRVHLGYHPTCEEALNTYSREKELYVKEVAEVWKGRIDEKIYNILIDWQVER